MSVRRPVVDVDDKVIAWIREHVLNPAVIDAILTGLRQRIEAGAPAPQLEIEELRRQLVRTEGEIARLTTALAQSDAPPAAVLAGITERERRATELRSRIEVLAAVEAPSAPRWSDIEAEVRRDLDDLGALFDADFRAARKALGTLLDGPLIFSQDPKRRNPPGRSPGG